MSINEAQFTGYASLPDEDLSALAKQGDQDAEEHRSGRPETTPGQ